MSVPTALILTFGFSFRPVVPITTADPCHAGRSCPAENHEYVWSGMSCASASGERRPEDQTPVEYAGVRYWCHAVVDQGMVPTSTKEAGRTAPPLAVTSVPGGRSGPRPNGADDGGIEACGRNRIEAIAVTVPFTRPTTIALSRLASLRRPTAIVAGGSGVSTNWYRTSGSIVSMEVVPSGVALVLRTTDGRPVVAVIPAAACSAKGSPLTARKAARALLDLRTACGPLPAKGKVTINGRVSVTGLAVWPDTSGVGTIELGAVVGFTASRCSQHSPAR